MTKKQFSLGMPDEHILSIGHARRTYFVHPPGMPDKHILCINTHILFISLNKFLNENIATNTQPYGTTLNFSP